jgi:phytoene synthase
MTTPPCCRPKTAAQRPGLIMAAIYRTVLNEVERDGYHVLQQRISLTPIRKLWLAWKTWVRG